MIKGVIFDFDGTLFDTMPFRARLGSSMIKKAGLTPETTAVFEDILVATRSAKESGFFTVAVEDIESAEDKEEIIKLADLYIPSGGDFNAFWSSIE